MRTETMATYGVGGIVILGAIVAGAAGWYLWQMHGPVRKKRRLPRGWKPVYDERTESAIRKIRDLG